MKTIWFDIVHPAHVNLFKNAIKILSKSYIIRITILDRGIIPVLMKEELPNFKYEIVTKRCRTTYGLILINNIVRTALMIFKLLKDRPMSAISCGQVSFSFPCKIMNIPNYQYSDDIERIKVVFLESLFATKKYFPPVDIEKLKKIRNCNVYNCMKQWAYLHPNYFKPNNNILSKYNLRENKYIFVREVDVGSFNYSGQDVSLAQNIKFPEEFKIVLSLEKKENIDHYPADWILLKEPVKDFHSLIYFSYCSISSGDSLAREAALLGVPSFYIGIRDMEANSILINMGILAKVSVKDMSKQFDMLHQKKVVFQSKEEVRNKLTREWDDLTEIITNNI